MKWMIVLLVVLFSSSVYAMNVPSFPYVESFDSQSSYSSMLQINPSIHQYSHQTVPCYSGGCAKLQIMSGFSEDSSGLGGIYFPSNSRLNMRWLQKWGPDYLNYISNEEWKALIFRRDGAERVMILEWHYSSAGSGQRTLRPCLNIDCVVSPNPGMPEFVVNDHINEWVSLEMEVANGVAKLYIDTLDGQFSSNGGTTPFATVSVGNAPISSIDIWEGYMEGSTGTSTNHYIMLDELVFDNGYIGPPAGFGGGTPVYQCSDGVDNDGDGDFDLADAGCSGATDNDESNCGDGVCEGGETSASCSSDCGAVPQTCSQLSGDICLVSETCSGAWLTASDSTRCCSVTCQVPTQTCSVQGGDICLVSETCSGSWLSASDSTRCCSVACQAGSTGQGIFFNEDFESGIQSFMSSSYGSVQGHTQFNIVPDTTNAGNNVLRYNFIQGQRLNDYVTQHFGDSTKSPVLGDGGSYDEIYVQFKLYYSPGFDWSAGNNKIMIIGTEDGTRYTEELPNPWSAHYTTIYAGTPGTDWYFTTEANNKNPDAHPWIGLDPTAQTAVQIQSDRWYTIEVHKQLNTQGQSNGIYEMWIDGVRIVNRNDVLFNVIGDFSFGTNWVMLSTYIDNNAPQNQYMYYDDIMFSTEYIGDSVQNPVVCGDGTCDPLYENETNCFDDCGVCVPVHEADTDCVAGVSLEELNAYFNRWVLGERSIGDLLRAVGIWKGL